MKNEAFEWFPKRDQAAIDVARDQETDAQISASLGVSAVTLWKWKQHPAFQQRVEQHRAEFRAVIRRRGIAVIENRVERLDRDWRKMRAVIESRAEEAKSQRAANEALIEEALRLGSDKRQIAKLEGELPYIAPGMESGLVVRDYRGNGPFIREVFAVDTALLAEIRAHEQQAAKELGQWVEKQQSDIGGDSLTLLRKVLIGDTEKPGTGVAALGMGTP